MLRFLARAARALAPQYTATPTLPAMRRRKTITMAAIAPLEMETEELEELDVLVEPPPPPEVHADELELPVGDEVPDEHAVAAAEPPVQKEFAGHVGQVPSLRYLPASHVVSGVEHALEDFDDARLFWPLAHAVAAAVPPVQYEFAGQLRHAPDER